MSKPKFDLNKVKEEIDKRQGAKGQIINENVKSKGRDTLLSDLVSSLNAGKPSKAVQKMKMIEGISKEIEVNGVGPEGQGGFVSKKPNNITKQYYEPSPPQKDMMPEREEKFESQYNQLVEQYKTGSPNANYSNSSNGGYLTEEQMMQMRTNENNHKSPQYNQLHNNNNIINEQIQSKVNHFMNEHFSGIVQEAMKNTIIEMYSVERVKKTLDENKDLIRNVVVEVIKELQQRKAANSRK